MLNFEKPAGWRVLELGCGANPHPASDVRVDVRSVPGITHFEVDFNAPEWPQIGDNDFEMILAIFVLEHISWRCVPNALKQILRILKPGGKFIGLVPNTEAQLQWILKRGWERRPKNDGDFVEAARILFGDLDYAENSHRSYFSPSIVAKIFSEAGFIHVTTLPFGAEQTDMVIEASKEGEIPTKAPEAVPSLPAIPPQNLPVPPPIIPEVLLQTPEREEGQKKLLREVQVPPEFRTNQYKNKLRK